LPSPPKRCRTPSILPGRISKPSEVCFAVACRNR
jgi:hypothetical protein